MSPSHPGAATPSSTDHPPLLPDTVFSRTPPRSKTYTHKQNNSINSISSPSPRTRLGSRDHRYPGARNNTTTHYHQEAVDGNSRVPVNPPQGAASPTKHKRRSSYTTFPPTASLKSNPPRTSSLFPAPRIAAADLGPVLATGLGSSTSGAAHAPPVFRDVLFNDPRPLKASTPTPAKEVEPLHKRGHSRSSSAGLSDGFRNLNRWSASTTASSRASNLAGFTKRVSAEFLGGAFGSPNRKLHKSRPSTSDDSPRSGGATTRLRSDSPVPAPIPPLQTLPPILTGPSLEDEVLESNVLAQPAPIERRQRIARPNEEVGPDWDGTPHVFEQELGSSLQRLGPAITLRPADPVTPADTTTMPFTQNGESRGHSRNRSTGAKGSVDTNGSSRSWEKEREKERERERLGKPPSQKAMLSKALQKANTAVQLDNVQNFEAARRAYAEACTVLQQVLMRTSGDEDRRKLDAIHQTYTNRIQELDEQLADIEPEGKELPERPESYDFHEAVYHAQVNGRDIEFEREPSSAVPKPAPKPTFTPRAPPPNLSVDTSRGGPTNGTTSYLTQQYSLQSAFSRARTGNGTPTALQAQTQNGYMPRPLSPLRRPVSPAHPPPPPPDHGNSERTLQTDYFMSGARLGPPDTQTGHQRVNSHESVSWLDPIDESEGSSVSSNHSRSSSRIIRKHIRAASGDTEAEFDAALDDAIEAAYDDGYEPEQPYETQNQSYGEDVARAANEERYQAELARDRVRDEERDALELATEREERLRLQQQLEDEEYRRQEAIGEEFWEGLEAEDEERMLEELTSGYTMDQFSFGNNRTGPSIPRESDSSGLTSRTWHSSMGSNPPHTANTVMTPISDKNAALPRLPDPPPPPPSHALPPPPPQTASSQGSNQSVRNRRLSGQNAAQLKIETTKLAPTSGLATAAAAIPSQQSKSAAGNYIVQQRQALSAGPNRLMGAFSSRATPSPGPAGPEDDDAPPLPLGFVHEHEASRSASPAFTRPTLRSNFSSTSLKSMKSRNLSISHMDDGDMSPGTPSSNQFGIGGSSTRLPSIPALPEAYKDRANSTVAGGMHLFDSNFHNSDTPGSPNPLTPDAPVALEPCPNDTLLRPFWLMRCLYQTLCHPRGGYVSNKLFVPRDVWRVKGVKLKNVEDKISNCDLLTAALQKLARVDTCDADLVLEEMQSLENVLEQVQAALSRKLGSEVGVQGSSTMFKDASGMEAEAAAMPRSGSVAGKGSSFSWRRLRSKNSSANLPGLATSYGGKGGSGGANASTVSHELMVKDALLASLPMTGHPTSRPTKRDVGNVLFTGPNANYMSSLARLFDAAQSLDQIARQVDDPGLRHADKTQVGLELCTRHAAEFFAFYICRFVLTDLTLLLDKFVKRGAEWVLV
ncbi:hypothetical protein B0T21DRAFT_114938 [Apiosordaria backusii]|uniref:MIT domain-containing protein n=1 Tax=Apiosordaria backusii TaxID=314023 RepID=A0AA39ZQ53_9PEZI|nr:hypothetical protein B0T21DRAFT_114938 [Apiosordaria backusii]